MGEVRGGEVENVGRRGGGEKEGGGLVGLFVFFLGGGK